jgi:hypothetical protein
MGQLFVGAVVVTQVLQTWVIIFIRQELFIVILLAWEAQELGVIVPMVGQEVQAAVLMAARLVAVEEVEEGAALLQVMATQTSGTQPILLAVVAAVVASTLLAQAVTV